MRPDGYRGRCRGRHPESAYAITRIGTHAVSGRTPSTSGVHPCQGQSPTDRLTFRGLEKNATTIRLAKMNLAVHGLEGDIQKAITYYEDPHELVGKANFVMANPPFNVDEIDADKVKTDGSPRQPMQPVVGCRRLCMANQLKMAKVHSILTLRSQGRSFRWIARELGVHRETVSRYVHLAEAKAKPPTCDVEGRPANPPGGPGEAEPANLSVGSTGWSVCEWWWRWCTYGGFCRVGGPRSS